MIFESGYVIFASGTFASLQIKMFARRMGGLENLACIIMVPIFWSAGLHFHSLKLSRDARNVQGWAKEWALGCVNPASWLPPTAGGEFTQPRAHSFAHLGTDIRETRYPSVA